MTKVEETKKLICELQEDIAIAAHIEANLSQQYESLKE